MLKNFFAAYVTAGDCTVDHCLALVEGGVDLLEIGAPFTDPVADGPVIAGAMERALASGATARTAVELAHAVRERLPGLPLILFGYAGPLLQLELDPVFNGVLVVDLPIEEGRAYYAQARALGIEPIYVVTPSTSRERMRLIGREAGSLVYYACRQGTTGERGALPDDFGSKIAEIREEIDASILAGFGIADRESARTALEHADGFVVGSAFVKRRGDDLTAFARSIDPR